MADDEEKYTPDPVTPPHEPEETAETPVTDREDAAAMPSDVSEPREVALPKADASADWKHDLRWAASLLLLAILGLSGWNHGPWQGRPEGRESLRALVGIFLGEQQYVFLLQLVGVLLVVALIGAVVMSIRDPETEETPRGGA